jgi:hypothetical protein
LREIGHRPPPVLLKSRLSQRCDFIIWCESILTDKMPPPLAIY